MNDAALDGLSCPRCRDRLKGAGAEAVCSGSACHRWPAAGGVANFLEVADDAETLQRTAEAYGRWFKVSGDPWARSRKRVWSAMVRESVRAAPPPGPFADLGAGSGGLAALATRAGYDSFALDAGPPPAGTYKRAIAPMEHLPFADGRLRVVAICASLHYARDVQGVLREARRALDPTGVLVLGLTPINSGPQAAQQTAEATRKRLRQAGVGEPMSSNYHHLVHAELEGGLRQAGFSLELRPSGLGSVREFARWAKGVVGRTELAKFPMVIARPVPTRHG